jgi:hypothetical protein
MRFKIRTGVGNTIGDEFHALRREPERVAHARNRERYAERRSSQQPVRQPAFKPRSLCAQPVAKSDSMPVMDEMPEERTAQEHDNPIAIQRGAFSRGRYVVESGYSVARNRHQIASMQ